MKLGENHAAAASVTDRRMRMEERDKQIRDKVDHRNDLCLEISLTTKAFFSCFQLFKSNHHYFYLRANNFWHILAENL